MRTPRIIKPVNKIKHFSISLLGSGLLLLNAHVMAVPISGLTFPDTNLDTCVTTTATNNNWTDSTQVTSLNCSNSNISDATGLGAFTNLVTLQLQDNTLTSLDVSPFTSLVTLYVYNNQLTTLSGLAGLTSLQNLYAYNNQLTNIDVTGNSAMVHLRVQNNALTTVGSTANMPNLSSLLANDNQISTLDVTGATSLVTLYAYNNQLTTLSGLAGLTSLQNLYAYNNQLTNIDVTGNSAMVHLRVQNNALTTVGSTANMPNLSSLLANDNQITSLDVTGATSLVTLYAYNNQLSTLSGLAGLSSLQNLYAYNNQLTNIDVTGNSAMVHMRVQNNALTSVGSTANMPNLSSLLANDNQITSLDVTGASSLVTLYAYNNQLSTLSGLAGLTSLQNLYAYNNQLTNIDVTGASALVHLRVQNNALTTVGSTANMPNLSSLLANDNQITSLDVTGASSLVTLYAYNNQLTALTGLAGLSSLQNLYAYNNQLTNIDVTGASAMVHLRVQNNALTTVGSTANMPNLSSLLANDNQISTLDVTGASSLVTLYAYNNQLTALTGLAGLTSLQNLYAYNNQLTNIDVTGDTGLVHLRVNNNQLVEVNTVFGLTQLSSLFLAGNTDLLCSQLDALEAQLTSTTITRPNPCNTAGDIDGDGIGDDIDLDRDGDGFDNDVEVQVGTDPDDANSVPVDNNGNGIPDVLEGPLSETTTNTYFTAADFGGDTSDPRISLLKSIDGPRTDVSDITTFDYDVQGNLIKTTNALNQETHITSHNAHGQPLTIVDANNITTTLVYDARRRLLSRTVDATGTPSTTTFEYDGVGNITLTTLPNGSFLLNTYDAAQRLTAVEDNLGNKIEYTLDALGNRTQEDVKDPQGTLTRTLSRTYNTLNRLIQTTGGAGQITTFDYDDNGNQTDIIIDPTSQNPGGLNQATQQAFDALNRLKTTTDPKQGVTTFGYDDRDNLTSVTDPTGLTTTYTYNRLDRLISQTSPDTGTTTFVYDSAGNRLSQTDARGITSIFAYDELNRLTTISYPQVNGQPNPQNITFTYDTGTACSNGIGRLCQMTDESGSTTYSYDARGNLLSQTQTLGSVVATTSYTYNSADQLTQITYPSGRTVDYTRNVLGQIDSVSTTHNSQTTGLSSVHTYEPFGPLNAMTYGNGLTHTRQYDLDYRLTQLTTMNGSVHQDLGYTFDNANNITDITNTLDATRTQAFVYDELNRLTDATGIYGDLDYSYDANGNRLTEDLNSSSLKTYSYDTANPTDPSHHLLQTVNGGTTTYSYDDNGNTTDNTDYQFTYGDNNRLKTAEQSSTVLATYTYNGRGERVSKVGASTTLYIYDQSGQLIAELDDTGTTIREYAYVDGQPLALVDGTGVNLIHTDHLGTPQKITDQFQVVVWEADVNPFGETTITTNTITNNLRFPGQYYDVETGLHYNYFRYYDSSTGRYFQSDPIGLNAGPNTYSYVTSNPINFIDPLGLVAWKGQLRFGSIGKKIKIRDINVPIPSVISDHKLELESECINNQKVEVLLDITNIDSNLLNLTPLFIGSVTLSDSTSIPSAGSLTGSFSLNFNSFIFGGGDIKVGSADGKFFGGGATIGMHEIKGTPSIIKERTVCCNE